MAKLYAEITSDKGGRVVGKGGDKHIVVNIAHGNNKNAYEIVIDEVTSEYGPAITVYAGGSEIFTNRD